MSQNIGEVQRVAILKAAGEEALVNTVQSADGFTADRVSARWTLRYGGEAAAIAHGDALGPVAAPAPRREAYEQ